MADEERKVHIYRTIGRSPTGPVPGTYLDLLRSEVYTLLEGGGPNYKRTTASLKWYADDAGKIPNPSRKTRTVKLIPPDEDQVNPQFWFEVDMTEMITVRDNDQVINIHFDNGDDNLGRKTVARRVTHMDTTADDKFTEDGVIPWDQYQKQKATKDKDQHLDVEIIQMRAFRDADQLYAIGYNNKALIDALDDPDVGYGEGQVNPPWRFDPLQIPINIKTRSADQQWLLAISNIASDTFDEPNFTDVVSARGARWSQARGGASGSGITVFGGAVAYGTITQKDGTTRSCFMACDTQMRIAKLGTIADGTVSWRTVWSAEGNPRNNFITGISYAKDRFFITFMGGDDSVTCYVVSTRDGVSFSPKQAPFPGRSGSTFGPYGGGVAYDKASKTYAMVGDDIQDDEETEFQLAFSDGFCWSTSSDGLTWSGGQIEGLFADPGGGGHFVGNVDAPSFSTVAAGNGVFVGRATKRNRVTIRLPVVDDDGQIIGEVDQPYILPSCAVAVSRNGRSWTLVALPGAVFEQDAEKGDLAGTTVSVAFVEDKDFRDAKGNTGYFVACGYEGAAQGFENAKLWRSVDGSAWSLIRSESHDVFAPGGDFVGLSAIDKNIKTVVVL